VDDADDVAVLVTLDAGFRDDGLVDGCNAEGGVALGLIGSLLGVLLKLEDLLLSAAGRRLQS
jgi:hypothetical protein